MTFLNNIRSSYNYKNKRTIVWCVFIWHTNAYAFLVHRSLIIVPAASNNSLKFSFIQTDFFNRFVSISSIEGWKSTIYQSPWWLIKWIHINLEEFFNFDFVPFLKFWTFWISELSIKLQENGEKKIPKLKSSIKYLLFVLKINWCASSISRPLLS